MKLEVTHARYIAMKTRDRLKAGKGRALSVKDILSHVFPGVPTKYLDISDSELKAVGRSYREDDNLPVHPVCAEGLRLSSGNYPKDLDEARYFLPIGKRGNGTGKKTAGFRMATEEGDLLYQAWLEHLNNSGAGSTKAARTTSFVGVASGVVSPDLADALDARREERSVPLALTPPVRMGELPPPDEDPPILPALTAV